MVSRSKLLALVPTLSTEDLQELKKRIEVVLGDRDVERDVKQDALMFLHHGISKYASIPPLPVLLKSRDGRAFRETAEIVDKFVRDFTTTRVDRQRGFIFSIGVLADYLRGGGIVVAARSLLGNGRKVPEVVEQAFPGYRKMGLLYTVMGRYE